MIETGEITITLQTNHHKVTEVHIHSTRPLHISRLFLGKTPEQVLTLIPLLFNICSIAQTYAAFNALSNALRIPVNSQTYHAQQMLLHAEVLREHCWWLCIAHDKQKLTPFVALVQQLKQALFVNVAPFCFNNELKIKADEITKIINTIHHGIEEIFLESPENFYNLQTEGQLLAWLNNNSAIPALLLTKIYAEHYQALGRVDFSLLPELNNAELFDYLTQDNTTDISRYPDWQGKTFETSSFNRQQSKPLINQLTKLYGNGLISRIVSRLFDLIESFMAVQYHFKALDKPITTIHQPTESVAQVYTARGLLIHSLIVEHNNISDYKIIAPTEWNFHPDGIIAHSLKTLSVNRNELLRQQAELIINTIDPCVAFKIIIK